MVDVSALGSAISIHAPREGSDSVGVMVYGRTTEFLSTLPVGGATLNPFFQGGHLRYFYPRSPWGERL